MHHNIIYLSSQFNKSIKLWHFNFHHDSSELFEDQLDALQTWAFKSEYLLFAQDFESCFWNKQVGSKRTRVSNGCFDIIICESIKWIYFGNCFGVHIVKDIIESRATFKFICRIFNKFTFNKLLVLLGVLLNNIKNQLLHINITSRNF